MERALKRYSISSLLLPLFRSPEIPSASLMAGVLLPYDSHAIFCHVRKKRIPIEKAGNAQVTSLGLQLSMDDGDHLLSDGLYDHLLLIHLIEKSFNSIK
ncbi:hypothetical protein EVAR_67529_1 [Eumeta japonica]|uniref:Uncharacterized protein n=1 Tax=Eumeta variegata TaxID=151549 RepID=A0A4C1YXR0_EUMVA|nr:hypothetical protein EVAR_67529_1 [Eumeta japonica]